MFSPQPRGTKRSSYHSNPPSPKTTTSQLLISSPKTTSPKHPLDSPATKMHRTYSMRSSRAPTASQIQNPPPPSSSTKSGRFFGKANIGTSCNQSFRAAHHLAKSSVFDVRLFAVAPHVSSVICLTHFEASQRGRVLHHILDATAASNMQCAARVNANMI